MDNTGSVNKASTKNGSFLNFADKGEFSQFGEAGLINEVIKRLKLEPGIAIEFGAPTKAFCSNIYHLEKLGWDCRFYDCDPKEDGIMRMTVTAENVNSMPACSIWSCDTDGPCASIWQAYTGKPALVIIEINSSLDPNVDYFTPQRGANYSYMKKLGERKGYTLLCHTGNMLWVLNEFAHLFPDRDETFNTSWL